MGEDRLDIEKLQLPRKDCKNSAANTMAIIKNMSRASSPDVSLAVPPISLVPPELIRRNSLAGRKRKIENEVRKSCSLTRRLFQLAFLLLMLSVF